MTLVDRYLNAVRFFLPRRQQDDIVRELQENLASQIEDRTQALDRDLTDGEVADILRRHGHPAFVAARFAPRQQLIGPVFFPIYVLALKIGLSVALLVTVVSAVIGAALRGGSVPHVIDGLLTYPNRALIVFAWTTIGFAIVDALGVQSKVAPDWDPRKLPDWMTAGRRQQRPPRLHDRIQAIVEVLLGVAVLGWLLAVPNAPWLAVGQLAGALTFAPVWQTWYIPMVLVAAANVAVDAYALFQPARTARVIVTKLILLGCQGAVALAIFSARVWVVARPVIQSEHVSTDKLPELLRFVNMGIGTCLAVVALVTAIEMGKQYYRLRHLTPNAER